MAVLRQVRQIRRRVNSVTPSRHDCRDAQCRPFANTARDGLDTKASRPSHQHRPPHRQPCPQSQETPGSELTRANMPPPSIELPSEPHRTPATGCRKWDVRHRLGRLSPGMGHPSVAVADNPHPPLHRWQRAMIPTGPGWLTPHAQPGSPPLGVLETTPDRVTRAANSKAGLISRRSCQFPGQINSEVRQYVRTYLITSTNIPQ